MERKVSGAVLRSDAAGGYVAFQLIPSGLLFFSPASYMTVSARAETINRD